MLFWFAKYSDKKVNWRSITFLSVRGSLAKGWRRFCEASILFFKLRSIRFGKTTFIRLDEDQIDLLKKTAELCGIIIDGKIARFSNPPQVILREKATNALLKDYDITLIRMSKLPTRLCLR